MMSRIAHARTFTGRSVPRLTLAALVAGALLLGASTAHAQKSLYVAAAKYAQCELKAVGSFVTDDDQFENKLSKCRVKYANRWVRLSDAPRFVDNGDGTVADNLTHLVWEQKGSMDDVENLGDPHDADNRYTWSAVYFGTAADGTIYTSFLSDLNGGCFAGQCDWRLPTRTELQTILLPERYPCATGPCIDPIFGPAAPLYYYSSTTDGTSNVAWVVGFINGFVAPGLKSIAFHVRAVRGGL
jgi:Protein of unknown function (DUF1566)